MIWFTLLSITFVQDFTIWSWTSLPCFAWLFSHSQTSYNSIENLPMIVVSDLGFESTVSSSIRLRVTCLESEFRAEIWSGTVDLSGLACTWGYFIWAGLVCPRSFPWIQPINVWGSLVSCGWFPCSFLELLGSSSWLAWTKPEYSSWEFFKQHFDFHSKPLFLWFLAGGILNLVIQVHALLAFVCFRYLARLSKLDIKWKKAL